MSEAIDVITGETEVSTTELACVLGITGRRIRQMAEDGQLQKVSKGRFLLADSVQRYVKFLSDGPPRGGDDDEGVQGHHCQAGG